MTVRKWTRRDAGFTLLELLLALALLTLITSTLLGGLHLGRRAWETGRNYESRGEVEAAAHAISGLFKRSFPVELIDARKRSVVVFSGRPDRCFFTTLSEGETQRAGLILTELGARDVAGRRSLAAWTKVYRAESALATTRDDMEETVVLQDLAAFDLSYYGAVAPNQPPAWRDSWLDSDHIPQLISVRLGVIRNGRRIETSFFVALPQE